jgi:hypothetical protein
VAAGVSSEVVLAAGESGSVMELAGLDFAFVKMAVEVVLV